MNLKTQVSLFALFGASQAFGQQDAVLPSQLITETREGVYQTSNSSSSTRTDTPVKQIPQSIEIINRSIIDDQQSVNVGEALKNSSGVITNDPFSTPAFETTKIRGFAAETLIDGFTQFYNAGDRESLVNVQSIEVLKGVNSLLYGGGAGTPAGGVVNIVSKKPSRIKFGEMGIRVGSNQFVQPFFDVNQPLSDKILFRVTGEYTNTESDIQVIKQSRYNLNPSITFTNNQDTEFTVQGKFSRWTQQEYQGLPATGTVSGNFRIREDLFIGNSNIPDSVSDNQGVRLNFDRRFSGNWSMNAQARFSKSSFDERAQSIYNPTTFDFTANSPAVAGTSIFGLGNVFLSQEQKENSFLVNSSYKFEFGTTKHNLLVGLDHSTLKDNGFLTFADAGVTVDLQNPVFTAPYTEPGKSPFTTIQDGRVTNTTQGIYTQVQSDLTQQLHTVVGLRQATVEVDYTELSLGQTQKTDKSKLLPRLGVVYDLTPSVSAFASYTEGLRGQPFAIFAPSARPVPVESESREFGLKFDFQRKLVGQMAVFDIDRSNVVVGFPGLPNGEQRSKGFDTNASWVINNQWKLLANFAYVDATFAKDSSATVRAGNQLAGVPKNSGRVWLNHNFASLGQPNLQGGVGVYVQGKSFVDDANQFQVEGFHTVDAAVSYNRSTVTYGLSVRNLTGENYFQRYEYFGGRVRPSSDPAVYFTVAYRY